ncbi:MDR family MFS transporter [Nocardia sp. NPDC048505]|uniref:MDR family MFS transporter n=1 Tax=unclassified Nocardia TaxID=2637762 RepID=UPI0033E20567
MDALNGVTFAGYVVEGVLGQGGMGTVYRARHPRLPRTVALKLLHRDVSADPELRARFEREANVVAHLDHPGIVAVEDRGVENGQLWLAMRYIEGEDASALDARTMTAARAVRIIGEVADALDYAHSRGVLHRDVKPANILLTAEQAGRVERAMLTDFGIARMLVSDTQLTTTGTFTATLAYASPEQLSGTTVDHRSDQYSLACTLFALLDGQAPFAAGDPGQVVAGHLVKSVPPLGRPDVPVRLDAVLARALAKDPAERYASAGEFAAAALDAVSGAAPARHQPPPTRHYQLAMPPQPRPPAYPPQRSPWPAVWAMAVGFFLMMLDSPIVSVALPTFTRELDITMGQVTWVLSAFTLGATAPLILAGRLGDRFGPKNIYLAGLAVFIVAALVCALSPGSSALVLARGIQGLGAALVVPQVLAVVVRTFAPGRRGMAMGLWVGAGGAATLLGPVLGGALVEMLGGRWVFLIDLPLGILALVLGAALIPALPAQRPASDPGGVLLSGSAVLLVLTGLLAGGHSDWPTWAFGLIAAGLLAGGLFLLLPLSGRDGLLPAAVVRDRTWWLSGAATMAATGAMAATLVAMSLYLQLVVHASPVETGLVLLPGGLVTIVCAPLLGSLADGTHPALLPALGFTVSGLAAAAVLAENLIGYPRLLFAVVSALLGFGAACLWSPLAVVATRAFPPDRAGVGAGIHMTTRLLGATIAATATTIWLNYQLNRTGGNVDTTLLHTALLPGAASFGGLLIVLLFTRPGPVDS